MSKFISWKTTTYGRVSTLEETLFSFINQDDLSNSEMVIINDYPLQELIFNHPQVKIINLKETFDLLGDKEQFAIEQCSGDIIATTDDDDIYMPNHNSNIKKYFKGTTNILHWWGVYYNDPNITKLCDIGNSGVVYSRKAWEKIGGSPKINAGGDSVLRDKLRALGEEGIVYAEVPNDEVSAWYRWGSPHNPEQGVVGIYHQSGMGFDNSTRPDIIKRHSAYIEMMRLKGCIPTGKIELKPHWKKDYKKMLDSYNKLYKTQIEGHVN